MLILSIPTWKGQLTLTFNYDTRPQAAPGRAPNQRRGSSPWPALNSGRLRESHFDARALARGRVHRNLRRMQDSGVLDDRETQTGTPGLS